MNKETIHAILYDSYAKNLENYISGRGIYCNIGFDSKNSEQYKEVVAKFLTEIGVDKLDSVSLEHLTRNENGKKWIEIKSEENLQILNSFVAYLEANGFINNNPDIALKNEEKLKEAAFVLNRLSRMVFPFNQLYFKYLNNHLRDINFKVNASNILGTIQGVKTR